jgi:hypothetical protein
MGASHLAINATEGAPLTTTVASFTDADPSAQSSDFQAVIVWGDGTLSLGTVIANGAGFDVQGTHTYSEEGNYTIQVQITDVGGSTVTTSGSASVASAAPIVTGLSPASEPTVGGAVVTIIGNNFLDATSVLFGDIPATFTIDSATQITATAPALPAGTVDVTVTTEDGTSATSASDQFTSVAGVPEITRVLPAGGPTSGGTQVVISGVNFSFATAVTFGSVAANSFTVDSDTQITVTVPTHAAGLVDIQVSTAGGTSSTSAADQFLYLPTPTVTAINPSAGPISGGTTVVITGSNFTNATGISFGGVPATSFSVNSDTQITAIAPAGSAGVVDVTVSNPFSTSATSSADQFTYEAPPTVTGLNPISGPTSGGTTVIITGTNFIGTTGVSFGGVAATSFTVNSSTQITAITPAHAAATIDVTVTTAGGTSGLSSYDRFTFVAGQPVVTGLSPTSGSSVGGTSVVITGINFTGATTIWFGNVQATSFTVNSDTQITATTPEQAPGVVDVTVTTAGGTSGTSAADQFTYIAAQPQVQSISPTQGSTAGGTTVSITALAYYSNPTAVDFGGIAATSMYYYNYGTYYYITATAPAHAAGIVDITVTTAGGTSPTSPADQFTYVVPPTVTAISPTSGSSAGGTSVVITGSNFTGATAVSFGGVAAASFTVNSDTSITATTPGQAPGAVDVTVTTAGGTSSTSSSDQFTYIAAQPQVQSVSPTQGSTAGGTTVSITALTDYSNPTAVDFDGIAATSMSYYNYGAYSYITATAPAHAAGTVDITVTTAGGTSPTSTADQFTYTDPPDPAEMSAALRVPADIASTEQPASSVSVPPVQTQADFPPPSSANPTTSATSLSDLQPGMSPNLALEKVVAVFRGRWLAAINLLDEQLLNFLSVLQSAPAALQTLAQGNLEDSPTTEFRDVSTATLDLVFASLENELLDGWDAALFLPEIASIRDSLIGT